MGKHWY